VIAGMLLVAGLPLVPAFAIATLVGGAVGLVNAYLVLVIRLPSLIATIGTLYVAQGVANIVTNGLPVPGVPASFAELGTGHIGGVPVAVPNMVIVVGLFLFIQRFTRLGRHIIALGSNRQAAFLNGVNTSRTLTYAFIASGLAAGWGGVMYGSRVGVPIPTLDNNLLFYVIVAIVIGGANLTGGEGSVVGTLIGAILIGVINNGLDLMGIAVYWQFIALGVVLVLSVASDGYFRRDIFHRLPYRDRRTVPASPSADTPTGTSA
jgi:ribose/xylose/arabinose/galactoside ABC-type transport system permease subunit